jgi:hypothetical protein
MRLRLTGAAIALLLSLLPLALPARAAPDAQSDGVVHPTFAVAVSRLPAGFPLTIRVPAAQAGLFDGLIVTSSTAGTDNYIVPGTLGYDIQLGRLGEAMLTQFRGIAGSQANEKILGWSVTTNPGESCSVEQSYCAFPGVGGKLTSEAFYGMTVGGNRAIITHVTCCNGHAWTVTWYDAAADTTYSFSLLRELASRVGGVEVTPANAEFAQQLADFGSSLLAVQR